MAAAILLRVLLAERLPLTRALLRDILASMPEVTLVGQVGAAHELVSCALECQPNLIVLDWTLAGPQGLQRLHELAERPLILVTLAAGNSDHQAALAQGATVCLDRSRLQSDVRAAVQHILAARRREEVTNLSR